MKKILIYFIFFFIFLFFPQTILANQVFFYDNFSNNLDLWKKDIGQWNIIAEGENKLLSTTTSGNDLLSQIVVKDASWKNYILTLKVKSIRGVDLGIIFRVRDSLNYYIFGLGFPELPLYPGKYVNLRKKVNGVPVKIIQNDLIPYNLNRNQWYEVKIITNNNNFKAYINNELVFDITDSSSDIYDTGTIGLTGWSGALGTFNFLYDDFKVESPLLPPTLLLPGLGGSWNLNSLLYDNEGGAWGKAPVDIYKNFRQTMINGGYQQGQNYDEFYYNWKKELDEPSLATASVTNAYSVKDLKDKVDAFYSQNGSQKINLVGHSLGGILARTYAQRYGTEKINKIVTVGSPHQGVVKAYNAWEGAEVVDTRRIILYDIILEGITFWRQKHFGHVSKLEALRKAVPSAKNLLPTFDFLIDIYGPVKVENMKQKNTFLFSLNQNLTSPIKNLLATVAGKDDDPSLQHDTLEWLQVMNPTSAEAILGYWEDGKPYRAFGSDDGDLTVLLKSAAINGAQAFNVTGTHDKIIQNEDGLNKIMQALELNFTPSIDNSLVAKIPVLLFWLHSPANFKVSGGGIEAGYGANNCNHCYYSPQDNLILINEAPAADYSVIVSPAGGGGNYHLDVGQVANEGSNWYRLAGAVTNASQTHTIRFDPQKIDEPPLIDGNGSQYLSQANAKLLGLKKYTDNKVLKTKITVILNLAGQAQKNLNKNRYQTAANNLLEALTALFETRTEIDKLVGQGKFTQEQRNYLKNEIEAIVIDLKASYLQIKAREGTPILRSLVKANLDLLNRDYPKLEAKAGKNGGLNLPLGKTMTLLEQMRRESQAFFDEGKMNESFISSFGSRFLILEANKLL